LYFKKTQPWVISVNRKLGCSTCREVESLGPVKVEPGTQRILAPEWVLAKVDGFGSTKSLRQKSLRKKVYEHAKSKAHVKAEEIKKSANDDVMKQLIVQQHSESIDASCNVFRTAYYIAKNDRPYVDHSELIDLQLCNGVNVGRVLHSNVVCSDIIDHIASNMRHKLVTNIVKTQAPISVLVDESTSLGQKSNLIVYLRFSVDKVSEPVSVFLDIIELASGTADAVLAALLGCLDKYGLDEEFLQNYWLGLGTDGAAVMTGKKAGLIAKIQETYPNVIGWHCFNHRLELAVGDAVKACTQSNHFKIFMDKLYSLYSLSNKNRHALEKAAVAVGVELRKIGRLLDTRWVSSSFRAVKAVLNDYAALHKHFSEASLDHGLDSKERSVFAGLAKKLSSPVFLLNLCLMYDALEELADLSESLQSDSITLPKAHKLIVREIDVLRARKNDGVLVTKYTEAQQAVECGEMCGVALGDSYNVPQINKQQFYQALCDSLTARLFTQTEHSLVHAISVVMPASWPEQISPEYGEHELKILCSKFLKTYNNKLKNAFRSYKDSSGKEIDYDLQPLFSSISTLPVSTAVCERGFSRMNVVCTPLRSSLSTAHMSSLLFISLVGPPLLAWDPLSSVQAWLSDGRRHANYTACMSRRNIEIVTEGSWSKVWKVLS
jgi:hypothetical protein